MIRAVVFDCDGVLVDSEALSCGAWVPVLARRGIVATIADIRSFIGKSDRAVLDHFERLSGMRLGERVAMEREEAYFEAAVGVLQAFPGVRDCITQLSQLGHKLAVASSGSPRKISFNLSQGGLATLLPLTVSAVDVVHGKPAPDLFLLASRRLDCPPSTVLVVEDSVPGLMAARAAGMHALGFSSSHPTAELLAAGAEDVFDDYAQLLPALERLETPHDGARSRRTRSLP